MSIEALKQAGSLPLAIQDWMSEQPNSLERIIAVSIEAELRTKTQEETNYSRYRQYEETGLYDVTLRFVDDSTLHRTFTRDELQIEVNHEQS